MNRPRRWRFGAALLSLLVFAALVSACGGSSSSSDSTAGTTDASSETTTAGETTGGEEATGKPIVFGSLCSCSGPLSWPELSDFYPNYEAWVNSHGGINGHPVEIKFHDDGGNPANATRAIHELVEDDKVQAIVGETSLNTGSWAEYLTKKGIPCVGCSYYDFNEFTNPNFFPTGTSLLASFYGAVEQMKAQGAKKVASMYCAEAPTCAAVGTLISKAAELQGGIESVAEIKVSASAPSYTPVCLTAKNAGAEGIYMGTPPPVNERLDAACVQQGYEPIKTLSSAALLLGTSYPGSDGSIEIMANGPIEAPTQYGEELREALGDMIEGEKIDMAVSQVFAGLQMFRHVAEESDLEPGYTTKELLAGLYEVKNETLNGGAGPITYVKGQPTQTNCYFPNERREGEWHELADGKPVCSPKAELAKMLEAIS